MFRASDLSLETLLQKASRPLEQCLRLTHENKGDSIASGYLNININIPTRCMNFSIGFLQALFFQWRFYMDDHTSWRYPSTLLNALVIALLRLATWYLEIPHESFGSRIELPVF